MQQSVRNGDNATMCVGKRVNLLSLQNIRNCFGLNLLAFLLTCPRESNMPYITMYHTLYVVVEHQKMSGDHSKSLPDDPPRWRMSSDQPLPH